MNKGMGLFMMLAGIARGTTEEVESRDCARLADLWSVRDAAKHMGVHEKTVYGWVESKRLDCIRVGNRIRFRPSDITRWLASRKEE